VTGWDGRPNLDGRPRRGLAIGIKLSGTTENTPEQ
jgi:hypothetical protein